MKKSDVVQQILEKPSHHSHTRDRWLPQREKGLAYAPTNIALCKYWGKRDTDINLPITSSFSIALPDKGTMTHLSVHDKPHDVFILNGQEVAADTAFAKRATQFLDLFRSEEKWHLEVNIQMNIPVAAGLASSASGFASLVLALNDLFAWELTKHDLSILARLGSGSASRSLWMGFVEWHAGVLTNGMDSFSEPFVFEWPELRVGILTLSDKEKMLSSREAMQQTANTSCLYSNWPKKVAHDMTLIKQAIQVKNFSLLGGTAESNALTMHATMLSSWPPISYCLPETIAMMHQIWNLRKEGLELYFTQDAGPNLKLLFLEKNQEKVKEQFPSVDIIKVFEG